MGNDLAGGWQQQQQQQQRVDRGMQQQPLGGEAGKRWQRQQLGDPDPDPHPHADLDLQLQPRGWGAEISDSDQPPPPQGGSSKRRKSLGIQRRVRHGREEEGEGGGRSCDVRGGGDLLEGDWADRQVRYGGGGGFSEYFFQPTNQPSNRPTNQPTNQPTIR